MSKIQFDVVFYDVTAYKPYDNTSLVTEGMGGTEATVVRVANGLASIGYTVAVVQHCLLAPVNYGNVYYLPESYLADIDTKRFVMLRGVTGINLFPKARKYAWMHDLANEKLGAWRDKFIDNDVTVIAVSKWHKQDIQNLVCHVDSVVNPKVTYIYNPVDDALYEEPRTNSYNKRKLVWMSSPHKGLGKAVSLFNRLKEVLGDESIELHVFNPGYLGNELIQVPGVITYGPTPPHRMWQNIKDALCVFYPCQFKETFGLVAAEANALGVPVATYELGALPEIVSSPEQYVWNNNEIELLKRVEMWYTNGRPTVNGVNKFKTTEVTKEWHSLLSAKNT